MTVYEIKSDYCYGFNECNNVFYFLDGSKTVNKLEIQKESHKLMETSFLYIKDKDRPNFQIQPYSKLIIRDNCIIVNSKIFYPYSEKPLDPGILDMEELVEI